MKRFAVVILTVFGLVIGVGCGDRSGVRFDFTKPAIYGLATPIQLNLDSSIIHMDDYFNDNVRFDTIWADTSAIQLDFDSNARTLKLKPGAQFPRLANLFVKANGGVYSILLKRSNRVKHIFVYKGGENVKDVRIKGEFNSWDASKSIVQRAGDKWITTIWVEPGTYQYKYLVDGREINDPDNPDIVPNGLGGTNSVLVIPDKSSYRPVHRPTLIDGKEIEFRGEGGRVFQIYAYWENYRIEAQHVASGFRVKIPPQAKELPHSTIRVYTANKLGISQEALIPLQEDKVVLEPAQIDSNDWRASIMYFAMVDRFNDGDSTNNEPVNDPEIGAKANYYGGDLAGIRQKIEDGYFRKLGINTIWISPIVQNPLDAWGQFKDPDTKFSGYHGYWPISSSKVDHRFGSDEDLEKLLEVAHDQGIKVILDYVANHVHKQHPVYQQHPDWVTDLYLPDGSLNTERWDDHRLTTWFDTFMPSLDLMRPEVTNYMVDSAMFWVNRFDLDGFRHDATKHIPENFWRTLTKRVKNASSQKGKHLYQIGETYGSYDLVGSYVSSGMLDGQFDFNLYDNALPVFTNNENPERLKKALDKSLTVYGAHHLMGNITGNQDKPRVMSYADGSLPFTMSGMEQKRLGWKQTIGVGDSTGYKKVALFTAFNMTIPGIPIIYYGDEIGMPGAGDPDNRRMMRFDHLNPQEEALRKQVEELTALRSNNLALIYGDFKWIKVSRDMLVYSRKYFDNEVVVVINLSTGTNRYDPEMGKSVMLDPLSYYIDIKK